MLFHVYRSNRLHIQADNKVDRIPEIIALGLAAVYKVVKARMGVL